MTSPTRSSRQIIGTLWLRAVAIGWGALCFLLALHWFVELGISGFPDGYISPYAQTTSVPLHILAGACMAQSVYFLFKGAIGRNMRAGSLCLQLAAAAALTVAPVLVVQHCPRSQACSSAYQALTGTMMDDGTGG